jgi:DNA-binding XRE family transcriptional regulator
MSRLKSNQPQSTNSPFKRLRLQVQLSQEQLAREIGVAVSTIRRWEKGDTEPTMTLFQTRNFCQAVQRDLDELPHSLSAFHLETTPSPTRRQT